jgi:hypothetical protein
VASSMSSTVHNSRSFTCRTRWSVSCPNLRRNTLQVVEMASHARVLDHVDVCCFLANLVLALCEGCWHAVVIEFRRMLHPLNVSAHRCVRSPGRMRPAPMTSFDSCFLHRQKNFRRTKALRPCPDAPSSNPPCLSAARLWIWVPRSFPCAMHTSCCFVGCGVQYLMSSRRTLDSSVTSARGRQPVSDFRLLTN